MGCHKSKCHIVQSDSQTILECAHLIFRPILIFSSAVCLVLYPGLESTMTQLSDWGEEAIIL